MSTPYLDPTTAPLEATKDAVFDKKLYVGTGQTGQANEQFEVRDRFEKLEQELEKGLGDLPNNLNEIENALAEMSGRISTADTKAQTGINNAATAQTAAGNAQTAATTVQANLTLHQNNSAVHIPSGGTNKDVLTIGAQGNIFWQSIMNLLPPNLIDIINNGGMITADQVINAFQQITITAWTYHGLPLGPIRIKNSIYAYDRFIVGGSDGRIAGSFGATWKTPVMLFNEPFPAAVEAFAYDSSAIGTTSPLIALDAYSDLRISLNRETWCKRLSVLVEEYHNIDGSITYKDRYETADFTAAAADRGLYVLFTTKGTVYRAKKDDVITEYHRATAPYRS